MTVNVNKKIFVVSPSGPLYSIEDFVFCPDRATADKEVENELDLSGQKMVVLECMISIPMYLEGGSLQIVEQK